MANEKKDNRDTSADSEPVPPPGDITDLLYQWNSGNRNALDRLVGAAYQEFRRLAVNHYQQAGPGQTLQPTALINEVYLRLAGTKNVHFEKRAQFFGFVARLMRFILVEYARAKLSDKRGAGKRDIPLEVVSNFGRKDLNPSRVEALDRALDHLNSFDARQAQVVELRFFAGLSVEETAEALKVSATTVKREYRLARHWLAREMRK